MAGLFGDGPLSTVTATSADGRMQIEYQRFCRRHAPQIVDITFPTQSGAHQAKLSIDGEYLQRVQITEIFPHPLESNRHETGQLSFATDGSGEPMTVRLHLQAQHAGTQEAELIAGAPGQQVQARFTQFVYP